MSTAEEVGRVQLMRKVLSLLFMTVGSMGGGGGGPYTIRVSSARSRMFLATHVYEPMSVLSREVMVSNTLPLLKSSENTGLEAVAGTRIF